MAVKLEAACMHSGEGKSENEAAALLSLIEY
jgi:hypothetical protein